MGRGILVEALDVPPHGALHMHGALLPVQTRLLQGRPVDGIVVGRQPPRPALFQACEPATPVEAGIAQAQIQDAGQTPKTALFT